MVQLLTKQKCILYWYRPLADKKLSIKDGLNRATVQGNKQYGLSFQNFDDLSNHNMRELNALLDSVLANLNQLKSNRDYFTEYYDNITDMMAIDGVVKSLRPNIKGSII